ncbi:MAG: hypothetical protein QME52_05980 [Bacteroidota bacterium]|nr:hypothetical protein [Bacteroidota bacterium]
MATFHCSTNPFLQFQSTQLLITIWCYAKVIFIMLRYYIAVNGNAHANKAFLRMLNFIVLSNISVHESGLHHPG